MTGGAPGASSKGSRMPAPSANIHISTEAHKWVTAHREREKPQTHLNLGRSAAAKSGFVRPSGGGTERSGRAAPEGHPSPGTRGCSRLSRRRRGWLRAAAPRRGRPRTPGGSTGGRSPRQETKGHTAPGRGRGRRCPGSCRAETEGRTGLDARSPGDAAATAGQPAALEGMPRSRGPDGARHGSALT